MSSVIVIPKTYAANPTITTLFTVTASGNATNFIIRMFGISDDITNTVNHAINVSYGLVFDGTDITAATILTPVLPSSAFSWVLLNNTASFNFAPTSSGGNYTVVVYLVSPTFDSTADVNY
jgi:hypothetical protein